jgi:hypothetical protein
MAASCDVDDPKEDDTETGSSTRKPTTSTSTRTETPTSTRSNTNPSSSDSNTRTNTSSDSDEPAEPDDSEDTEPAPTAVAGVDCPDPKNLKSDFTVQGDIRNSDTVWKGVVHVTGDIDVFDASITIEPGTVILVDKGRTILMGDLGEVLLTAAGTKSKPIRFCGSAIGPGHWAGLSLNKMNPASVLSNVLVDGAGSEERALGIGGEVLLQHLRITNSGGDGLRASTYAEDSDDFVIEGSAGYPVVFTGASAVTRFPINAEFVDNQIDLALVRFTELGDESLIYHDIGIPYLQEGDFAVAGYGGAKLTFEAGVEYRISKGRRFLASANPTKQSELHILGTAKAPVLMNGSEEAKGHWRGLIVESVSPGSSISNLIIADAGNNDAAAFLLKASIEIQDLTIRDSANGAVFEKMPADGSANFSSTGNDGYPLTVPAAGLTKIPAGGMIEGNEIDMIKVTGSGVPDGTIQNFGIPYRTEQMAFNGDVKIEAGTEFVVAAGAKLFTAGGSIQAIGTSSKRIIFRGEQDSSGSWAGIRIQDDGSTFTYVKLMNAGLQADRPTTITNSSFSGSPTFGITKRTDDETDYMSTNTFSSNAMGPISM